MLSLQSNCASSGSSLPRLGYQKAVAQHSQQSNDSSPKFKITYRTYADTETLAIYFTKAKPGVIANTDHIGPGIVADYAEDGRLVSLDICAAPKKVPCHFFATTEMVDGKQPLAVNWSYDHECERLTVLLSLCDAGIVTDRVQTDDVNITLGMDAAGKLCAVFVDNPVTNTFTSA